MAKNSCQRKPNFLEILGTKVGFNFDATINWQKQTMCSYIDIIQQKKVLERFGWFLTLKIDLENQILALFDIYFLAI